LFKDSEDVGSLSFGEALSYGKLGAWVQNRLVAWIVVAALLIVGAGGFALYRRFVPETPGEKAEAALQQARTQWERGDQAGAIATLDAAGQGDARIEDRLGKYHLLGTAHDEIKAAQAFARSAQQGFAEGQYDLAYCYEFAKGVEQSDSEALNWCRAAADQGHADAENAVGRFYLAGRGGAAQDAAKAAEHFGFGAERGSVPAQANLARSYLHGTGVAADPEAAYRWARLASVHGAEGSEVMASAQDLAAKAKAPLTPDLVKAAEAWVSAWKPGGR
jgi:TPR repeat protein